jgi:hypothetical protein
MGGACGQIAKNGRFKNQENNLCANEAAGFNGSGDLKLVRKIQLGRLPVLPMVAGHAPLDKGFAKSVFNKVICAFSTHHRRAAMPRRGSLNLMRPIGCVLHHITELYETVRSLDASDQRA